MAASLAANSGMSGRGPATAAVIARIAARRHAVVTRVELLAAGCRSSTVGDWVRVGHLHRIHRGVYSIVPPSLLSREGCWLAAVLACGKGAALSHEAAGQLAWIVDASRNVGLHVSVPGDRRPRVPGVVTHRPVELEPVDLTTRCGIPTTTRTRTVWDLAYVLSAAGTRRAFHQAEKRHDLDRRRLRALVESAPSRRGSRTIRELLLAGSIPLDRTRSALEDIIVELCDQHALPMPRVNVRLRGYEVDFLWERQRFVIEADGGDHLNEEQRDKDNARDAALTRAGYFVRRFTWWALEDRRAVAAEILAILEERCR